ncbi:tumor necrosis factor receptor superfamily member 25 isoform X4 [Cygnus olor]|uniref:tumor necrosis factor receptor superfamily member 25 isoform X4 n=1 Tax=Cygnus olor TaxID=8869 RepID=UPI001ADE2129|nr:tumor necrosis factor receptor superfamily member 25 isoform X4 [Cygnus olor]
MKRHCPGAASVFLAVLWLLASGLLLLGCQDCAVSQGQRGPARLPARPRRLAAKPSCPAGMNWIDAVQQCCPQCPPGTYLKNPCSMHGKGSDCEACPDGTYHSQPNTRTKCHVCYECDHHAFQRVLSNCSATSNVACGCKPGHFRSCLNEHCNEFSCSKCQLCPGRLVQRPCSDTQDTLCGSCKPNFYAEGSECRPCHMSTPETCGEECQQACGGSTRGSGLQYLLLALTVPLFMGAFVIYKRRWLQHRALVGSPLLTVPPQGCPSPMAHTFSPTQEAVATETVLCQVCEHGPSTARKSPESWALHKCPDGAALLDGRVEPSAPQEPSTARGPESHPRSPQRCTLLQGSQLYAVINVVPVRRWKEFMRVLELRDTEIELVEMEVTHFRDQQYEMLKRWCQQTSATLDRIFAALEHMELAGCAEALRQSLSAGP